MPIDTLTIATLVVITTAFVLRLVLVRGNTAGVKASKARIPGACLPGDICSVADSNGYRLAKVLAVDSEAVHIRLFKSTYPERPQHVDGSMLTLGSIHDADGFGIGHLPVSHDDFKRWQPVLLTTERLTEDELEGYKIWERDGGGVWGGKRTESAHLR